MNHDLMLVIEDQWRKQLHEEHEQEEADRRKEEANRVERIVAKEGRMSRQGREADETELQEATGEVDGRSEQEVALDGREVEGAKVREGGRRGRGGMSEKAVELVN